ncbi:MAG TPA: TRAP transporter small permease [Kiritimatiellia bacterium]|nr:TRAP transporter small permease [Kiritimatiellia bacterium]HPS08610.1 TRAP transporter small permease [Kiritimatiellia bacterium]
MIALLQKVKSGFIRSLEILVMVMVAMLTLTVLWGVFTRFCLGNQAEYTDELARMLLVWVTMIGAALAFGVKAHLGVDFFVNLLHADARKTLSILVQVVIIALSTVVFMLGGWGLAMGQMGQQLPTLPISRGMVYISIPLGGVLICLFALENLMEIIKTPAELLGAQTKSEE